MNLFAKTIACRRDYDRRTDLPRISRSWRIAVTFCVMGRHGSMSFWTCLPFFSRRVDGITVWQLAHEYGQFESMGNRTVREIGMSIPTAFRMGRLFGFPSDGLGRSIVLWGATLKVIRGMRDGEIRLGDGQQYSIAQIAGL